MSGCSKCPQESIHKSHEQWRERQRYTSKELFLNDRRDTTRHTLGQIAMRRLKTLTLRCWFWSSPLTIQSMTCTAKRSTNATMNRIPLTLVSVRPVLMDETELPGETMEPPTAARMSPTRRRVRINRRGI